MKYATNEPNILNVPNPAYMHEPQKIALNPRHVFLSHFEKGNHFSDSGHSTSYCFRVFYL